MSRSDSNAAARVDAQVLTRATATSKAFIVQLSYSGAPPQDFINDLEAIGFQANGRSGERMHQGATLVVEEFGRAGTGAFGGWTPADTETGLRELQALFSSHGVEFAPSEVGRAPRA